MVLSWDGGRTYPLRHRREKPLSADPPNQPATVFVYDPATGTGRATICDFDVKKAKAAGAADPVGAVAAEAAAFTALVARAGGECLEDVSPGGGRHVYVLWERAQPWLELKQFSRALARRYPSLDTSPHNKLGGLIRPPGSRYRLVGDRSPGWQLLTTPLADVVAITARRCGPRVWNALHAELAAELEAVTAVPPPLHAGSDQPGGTQLDSKGSPWLPRIRRLPLREDLEQIARTGRYPARYPTGSEARMAGRRNLARAGIPVRPLPRLQQDRSDQPGLEKSSHESRRAENCSPLAHKTAPITRPGGFPARPAGSRSGRAIGRGTGVDLADRDMAGGTGPGAETELGRRCGQHPDDFAGSGRCHADDWGGIRRVRVPRLGPARQDL
jgi:hypothetical protein